MNTEHNKIGILENTPFDKALLSEAEGLRANGINQSFLKDIHPLQGDETAQEFRLRPPSIVSICPLMYWASRIR